jgi:hypothetical protein
VANDVDIIVGVKDLATAVLDRLSSKVNSIGDSSKLAFAGAAERLNEQLAKASSGASSVASAAGNEKLAKSIEQAANAVSNKLDAALAKTNATIDGITGRIQNAIGSVTKFVTKAAEIGATVGAFFTIATAAKSMGTVLVQVAKNYSLAEMAAVKTKEGMLAGLAPYLKMAAAAGSAKTLATATLQVTSSASGLASKATGLARATLASLALNEALRKTNFTNLTFSGKLVSVAGKAAGVALAFDVASRATLRFGLSLIGLGKQSDNSTTALTKVGNSLAATASKISVVPFNAVKTGATAAAAATLNLSSKIEDLPKGAQSVNSLVSAFGNFATQIGGIPGLLLSIPAGIAGVALAAATAAIKTERQLTQLTNKLAIVEAAKKNAFLSEVDFSPLRKIADETERVAKMIQTATNVPSSKLLALATSSLTKGLDTTQLGDALQAAVGLSEVYGTSIEDGMYRVRQAIDGNFESFEKLIPAIADMTTNQEKLDAVSKMAANGFKVMSWESTTFWGTIEKVRLGLGNVLESLGRFKSLAEVAGTILRDVVTPAVMKLETYLKGFGFDGAKIIEGAKGIAGSIVATINTIRENWDLVWQRMSLSTDLFWERLYQQSMYFGKTVIPWVIKQVEDAIVRAFERIGDKIQEASNSALGLFGVKTNPVLQRPDPKSNPLKPRDISAQESLLAFRIKSIDTILGAAFGGNFLKAITFFNGMLAEQEAMGTPKLKSGATKNAVDSAIDKSTQGSVGRSLQAFEARLLTRGSSQDSVKSLAQSSAQTSDYLRRLLIIQERIAKETMLQPTQRIVVVGKGGGI